MAELRVVRHTDRFEESCWFYGDVLGWPVTKQWDEPDSGRIYGYGESARVELLRAASGTFDAPSGVYLAVEVDDVASAHAAVRDAGVAVTHDLSDQPWGHRNFGVTDPTGMTMMLFEVIA